MTWSECFPLHHVVVPSARECLTLERDDTNRHYGKTQSWQKQFNSLGNVLVFVTWWNKPLQGNGIPQSQGLFIRVMFSATLQNCSEMVWEFKVLIWPPNSPEVNEFEDLWNVLDKLLWSMEAPPHIVEDLKGLLLMSWFQRPQHRYLVEWTDQSWFGGGVLHNIRQVFF